MAHIRVSLVRGRPCGVGFLLPSGNWTWALRSAKLWPAEPPPQVPVLKILSYTNLPVDCYGGLWKHVCSCLLILCPVLFSLILLQPYCRPLRGLLQRHWQASHFLCFSGKSLPSFASLVPFPLLTNVNNFLKVPSSFKTPVSTKW